MTLAHAVQVLNIRIAAARTVKLEEIDGYIN